MNTDPQNIVLIGDDVEKAKILKNAKVKAYLIKNLFAFPKSHLYIYQ